MNPTTTPDARTHPVAHPPHRVRGPDWWLMLTKFLKQGRRMASVAPSSRFMCRRLVHGIDFEKAECIVELGAGTGPVTAEIMRRLRPDTRFVIVELDRDLCARLKARFPKADIVHGDAAHFDKLLAERGITSVDHVVSGLPLPSFPAAVREAILATSSRTLTPDGTFRQLTVMPWVYYKMYRGYFTDVRFKLVPLNMPPGGVYVCRGYKDKTKP